ncbi:MAG: histidinol-phosphate transaminase [Tahibacter sp.]
MSVLDLARAEIRTMKPYSSARAEFSGIGVALNANESPWGAAGAAAALNRYPEPQPPELVSRLAALYTVDENQVLVGRGSDEPIDLLVRAFCRAGQDSILICPPTFGMYAVAARVQDAAILEVPLNREFHVDPGAVLARIGARTRLVFLCTPNNPTGASIDIDVIEALLIALQGRSVVVVDEAYLEFAERPSALTLLARHDNLVVLRTLSKAHALAAARVGVLIAQANVVELLRRIIAPYPLPAPSVAAALAALGDGALLQMRDRVRHLRAERERLRIVLSDSLPVVAVLPSEANFLCVRWRDGASMYGRLLAAGIVVRDVSRYPGLQDCLRLSIGTPEQNDALLRVVADAAGGH